MRLQKMKVNIAQACSVNNHLITRFIYEDFFWIRVTFLLGVQNTYSFISNEALVRIVICFGDFNDVETNFRLAVVPEGVIVWMGWRDFNVRGLSKWVFIRGRIDILVIR